MRSAEIDDDVMIGAATDADAADLMSLWTRVFCHPSHGFTGMLEAFPPDRQKAFAVREGGRLVASVQLFLIPIRDENGNPETVGGIANVATDEDSRGRHYSTRLLRLAIEAMHEADCGWSFLFTGVPDFYARLGWESQIYHAVEISPKDIPAFGKELPEIGPEDLDAIRRVYDVAHAATPLAQVRSDGDWSANISRRLAKRIGWSLGDAEGYALARTDGDALVLEEWAVANPEASDYQTLLSAASSEAVKRDLTRLIVSAPIDAAAQAVLDRLPAKPLDLPAGMARPIRDNWSPERIRSLFARSDARFFPIDNF